MFNDSGEHFTFLLQVNGYPATWHAEVTIVTVAIEDRAQKLQEAQLLSSTKDASPNEIREMLGLEGVSDKELVEIREQWKLLEMREQWKLLDQNV